ncbi:MAG: hypothetical protein KC543_10750 [Myxococcales bacterium]|nr:hypothetical protein [Myxococcales bacterium]
MRPGRKYLPVVLAGAAGLSVASAIGMALAPTLLVHSPLGLIALSPLGRHLVLVATVTSVVPFVAVAVVRRALGALTSYGMGFIYGERMLHWMKEKAPRYSGLVDKLERGFQRAGPALLFVFPGVTFSALAGIEGMRLRYFVPTLTAGLTVWMTAFYYVGDAFRDRLAPVMTWLSANMIAATVISLAVVLVYEIHRRTRAKGAGAQRNP